MNSMITNDKPALVPAILHNRCPRCRRGDIYKHSNAYKLKSFMQMNDHCAVCGQSFDMEVGFYYGTSYVSYGLSIAICAATFVAWWALIGFSLQDNRFFWWIGVNALVLVLLQPLLMRIARTIWLAIFVHYSPNWQHGDIVQPERTNSKEMNNW
jgi:uncharacterized protein (DUF983 family)